jgi:phosphatidylserine/phosphatidylglycerophosphate/cardiolipin synthase-like enzyme
MHPKLAIVNGDTILAGSFNGSPQAANDNYENLLVLSGLGAPGDRPVPHRVRRHVEQRRQLQDRRRDA